MPSRSQSASASSIEWVVSTTARSRRAARITPHRSWREAGSRPAAAAMAVAPVQRPSRAGKQRGRSRQRCRCLEAEGPPLEGAHAHHSPRTASSPTSARFVEVHHVRVPHQRNRHAQAPLHAAAAADGGKWAEVTWCGHGARCLPPLCPNNDPHPAPAPYPTAHTCIPPPARPPLQTD